MTTRMRPEISKKNKCHIKGITEERPYTYLRSKLGIPCGRDMYYEKYRKFFWLLNEERERIRTS